MAANLVRLSGNGAVKRTRNRPHGQACRVRCYPGCSCPDSATVTGKFASLACEIVHISYQDPQEPKGGELVAVLNLCQGLIDVGQRVTLLTPCSSSQSPHSYSLNEGRLQVIRLRACESPAPTLYGIDEQAARTRMAFARAAAKYVRSHFEPTSTIIHAHGFSELVVEAGMLRCHGYPVVAECHMFISERAQRLGWTAEVVGRLKAVESEALLANDTVVVHSRDMAEAICRICPDFRGTVHVWSCAIEAGNFQPALACKSRTPTVIGVGRISPEKGWERYLAAAKIVSTRRSPDHRVRFILVGKTDDAIPARQRYSQRLRKLAQNSDCIHLLVNPEGIWGGDRIRLVDRSSIAVVPSIYEPFGLTMAEFMARGKPVVSCLTSGAREILGATQPGPTAFGMVAEDAPESLTACIEHLLDHPEQAREMGRNARGKAKRSFRPSHIARYNLELYRACLARRGGRPCRC